VKDGDVRTEYQGSLDQIKGEARIALLVAQHAQHMKRAGVGLIAL